MVMNISLPYLNISADLINIYPIIRVCNANETVVLNLEDSWRPFGFQLLGYGSFNLDQK
jgi:hypothetical protein